MISFVWLSKHPFLAGTGGSENYTAGHIRELRKRGIDANIITIGLGENDGRDEFPDISFKSIASVEQLSDIDATLVFIIYPVAVKTKRQSYVILHCPLSLCDQEQSFFDDTIEGKKLIAPSKFAAQTWAQHFGLAPNSIPVAYPFADEVFSNQPAIPHAGNKTRILFAGRLTPDKGVYTLMAALHFKMLKKLNIEITATTACDQTPEGQIIKKLFQAHPQINLIPARKSREDMARLMAEHDIVVMPTTNIFWHEAFGIVSVEAQHAGCRVVASNAGGLPETDCGGLVLVDPDNPYALAQGLVKAAELGRLSDAERAKAVQKFTVEESVDELLKVLGKDAYV